MQKSYNTLLTIIEKLYPFLFILLSAITAFLCFRCLPIAAIDSWDEARHGISAYEMMKNHNYLINTYLDLPDYWNVKPPLSFLTIIHLWLPCFGAALFLCPFLPYYSPLHRAFCQTLRKTCLPFHYGASDCQLFSLQSPSCPRW